MDANRRRQGGRGRRLEGTRVPQLPWTQVSNPYPPMEMLSADQIEAIHLTSLRILEELGMEIMSARALAVLEAAGADVDTVSRAVRVDRGLVEKALETAPSSTRTHSARNTGRRVDIGAKSGIHFRGWSRARPTFMISSAGGGRETIGIIATSSGWRSTSMPSI